MKSSKSVLLVLSVAVVLVAAVILTGCSNPFSASYDDLLDGPVDHHHDFLHRHDPAGRQRSSHVP